MSARPRFSLRPKNFQVGTICARAYEDLSRSILCAGSAHARSLRTPPELPNLLDWIKINAAHVCLLTTFLKLSITNHLFSAIQFSWYAIHRGPRIMFLQVSKTFVISCHSTYQSNKGYDCRSFI